MTTITTCSECGANLLDNSKFCHMCGTRRPPDMTKDQAMAYELVKAYADSCGYKPQGVSQWLADSDDRDAYLAELAKARELLTPEIWRACKVKIARELGKKLDIVSTSRPVSVNDVVGLLRSWASMISEGIE